MSANLESQSSFEATLLGFLSRQLTRPKQLLTSVSLTDQVALITGANAGLGLAAARQLLQLGLSHLVMGVRSVTKGEAAAAKLREQFPLSTITVWTLNLEDYESVCALADHCLSLPRLDIAILNAGMLNATGAFATAQSTGHEITLQVNYLSTALLAILLLPHLERGQGKSIASTRVRRPPVLTLVGSDRAYNATLQLGCKMAAQFNDPEKFSAFAWYSNSKLLLTMFVSTLARLVSPDAVLINMVNPGMTKDTLFFRDVHSSAWAGLIALGQFLLARSVDVAATTYVDAVVARGAESHGSFLSDWMVKPYPKMLYSEVGVDACARLWEETLAELAFANVTEILESFRSHFEFLRQISENPENIAIGIARDKAATEKKCAEALGQRSNVFILEADITDYDALKRAAEATARITSGTLDYLIANAAYVSRWDAYDPIGTLGATPQALEQDLLKSFHTNVISNIHLLNLFIPLILTSSTKKILVLSTGSADLETIRSHDLDVAPAYTISKAAMNFAVAKFSAQYREQGLLVMSVCPGVVQTGHYDDATPEQLRAVQRVMGKFAEYAPGFIGPVGVEVAVGRVLDVWERASVENGDGGSFVSQFGNKTWL
ncbi:short-chain dehydrogenase [Aspergillus ustus]|uniref:Short-chain dehydrogenase n=1 Tax=Aspergillus ustus TaxID=40382 RepID=A0A0C1E2L0_ASPUT|nr:short-chain dehydrogenase [Aspergillus ustus]